MRICFLGDSFVNGTGDDDGLGWTRRVVARLRAGGADVTGYELGVRRDTSLDVLARWRAETGARLPAGTEARLAFSFGANDCADGGGGEPRVPPARTVDAAREILLEAVAVAPTIVIGPVPILDDPRVDARVLGTADALEALCAELGVPHVRAFEFVAGCAAWREEAARGDGTHPNRGGYAALAKELMSRAAFARWCGSPAGGRAPP